MIKLGMGDVIRSAFVALWRGGWPMLVCLALWFGAELVNQTWQLVHNPIGRAFAEPLGQGPGQPYFPVLSHLATSVIGNLVSCGFIAAMLRMILTGQAGPWSIRHDGLVRASGAIFLVSLAATVFMNGPSWLLSVFVSGQRTDGPFDPVEIGLSLLFSLVGLYLIARLCLIYPSMAVGRGWGLRRYWRRSSGNGIRLTMVFLMVLVAYFIADTILEISVFGGFQFVDPDDPSALHWTIIVRRALFVVLVPAYLMSLFAVVFARLTEYPAARIPGSSRTPEQLAEAFD